MAKLHQVTNSLPLPTPLGFTLNNPLVIDACCIFLQPLDHLLVCDAEFLPRVQQGGHDAVLGVRVNYSSGS